MDRWLPLAGVFALWAPAMLAASYAWQHGEYYDYGWFVPPAAIYLTVRRWMELEEPARMPRRGWWIGAAVVLLPWILVLRVMGYADPAWRMPMGLLGLTAALCSHWLIAACHGWKISTRFVWITLLWMSALPWPSVVESRIVHQLTQGVVAAVADVFQILGRPVEVTGDRLQLHEVTVEVTDGCSGVRSFQSFIMASWFFSELQRLSLTRALTLLACACAVAFVVNMGRTYTLAQIRFDRGEAAFDRAHDAVGLAAFVISALVFFFLSGKLSAPERRMVVRSVQSRPQ